jgi:hypothetical protein
MDAGDVADATPDAVERPEACPAEASQSLQDRKEELIQRAREQLKPIEANPNIPIPTMTPLPAAGASPGATPDPDAPEIIKVPVPKAPGAKGATSPDGAGADVR